MVWVKIYCDDCKVVVLRRKLQVDRGESILSAGDALDHLTTEANVLHNNHDITISRE